LAHKRVQIEQEGIALQRQISAWTEEREGALATEQRRNKERFARKELVLSVAMPLVDVIIAGAIGTFVAIRLQDRSFRKNEVFKARVEQIVRQRNDAVSLLQEVDEAWRQVRLDEEFVGQRLEDATRKGEQETTRAKAYYCENAENRSAGYETLRRTYGRALALDQLSRAFGEDNQANKSIRAFTVKLQAFLSCAENRECLRCAEEHSDVRQALEDLISGYSKLENTLVDAAERWRPRQFTVRENREAPYLDP
jgi:hypothetical protein